MTDDAAWLAQAIELAVHNVADGGGPFGALVVRGEDIVATGQNRVTRDLDPTAHAEVQAIRNACQAIGDFSLAGMTLYTSCEPCPLCISAALWARLDRVVYAADRDDAALVASTTVSSMSCSPANDRPGRPSSRRCGPRTPVHRSTPGSPTPTARRTDWPDRAMANRRSATYRLP